MTRAQKIVCLFLCFCMMAALILYLPLFFWIFPEKGEERIRLAEIVPLISFCRRRENSEPQTEDAWIYSAVVEANRRYLASQVVSENDHSGEKEEKQEKPEEKESGEGEKEEKSAKQEEPSEEAAAQPVQAEQITRAQLENYDYLLENFFIVDSTTATDGDQINAGALMDRDMSLAADQAGPQILIYHSHTQEGYVDSDSADPSTTVVGVGDVLMSVLQEQYGYGVIHVKDVFDMVNGELDRSSAYDYARERVEQVLAENPTVEVVIDLHRDGVPEERHLVTEVDGKPTAQFMFFNGLSYSVKNGNIEYLPNPYIPENLAFSFQMELAAKEYYPGLCRGIYLSSLRYNLHLKPRAILLEVGAQNNTVQEAKNAMTPFAWILHRVLSGAERQ